MPFIDCPECESRVSEYVDECPECGATIAGGTSFTGVVGLILSILAFAWGLIGIVNITMGGSFLSPAGYHSTQGQLLLFIVPGIVVFLVSLFFYLTD